MSTVDPVLHAAEDGMRRLAHPGEPSAARWRSATGGGRRAKLRLRGGLTVNEAVARALDETGFDGGFLRLDGATLAPLRYVIPAGSDGVHAAWYSETFAPKGVARIEEAGAIAGWRNGERFIHCHGVWTLADGSRRGGHLLPQESILERDATVEAIGLEGATFEAEQDPETGFKLFAPKARGSAKDGRRAFACTIRPNEDVCTAIEAVCRENHVERAAVSGVGSLIGADFEDGGHVASYATELLVREGRVEQTQDGPRCRLEVVMVGMDGAIAAGVPKRGRNPVCITFELVIEELGGGE